MGLLSGLIGGLFANHAAKQAYKYQRSLNEQQDTWMQNMASTQYQRGYQDMIKAGMNPALMYKGAASDAAPSAGQASSSSAGALQQSAKSFGDAAGSATELPGYILSLKNQAAQNDLLKAQTASQVQNSLKTAQDVQTSPIQRQLIGNQATQVAAQTSKYIQDLNIGRPDEYTAQGVSKYFSAHPSAQNAAVASDVLKRGLRALNPFGK